MTFTNLVRIEMDNRLDIGSIELNIEKLCICCLLVAHYGVDVFVCIMSAGYVGICVHCECKYRSNLME